MAISGMSTTSRKLSQLMFPLMMRSSLPGGPAVPASSRCFNIKRLPDTMALYPSLLEGQRFQLFSSATSTNTAQPDKDKEGEGQSQEQSAKEESETEKKLRDELNKAMSENATLLSKSRDFEDKYKRALAETENLRTRLTKQINDAKLYAVQGFCKDMTEISDILRMAIDSVPKDQVSDSNPHLKGLYDGLAMTESRLLQVFKSHGLVQINPMDEKFNPNEHEAVVQQEVEGKESGTVIFVSKLGYKLHDRVIRPAVVGVAK